MDIVERLRQRIGLVKFDSDAIALHDAANIIEQLRRQVEFERKCREDTYADLEKQDAEIERLRGMLISALDGLDEYWVTFPEGVELVNQIKALQQKEIA